MQNVVDLATYRSLRTARNVHATPTVKPTTVVQFTGVTFREKELRYMDGALINFRNAQERRDRRALAEWRDQLKLIAFHTEFSDIRQRCEMALAS